MPFLMFGGRVSKPVLKGLGTFSLDRTNLILSVGEIWGTPRNVGALNAGFTYMTNVFLHS